jgi:hypothetical protein
MCGVRDRWRVIRTSVSPRAFSREREHGSGHRLDSVTPFQGCGSIMDPDTASTWYRGPQTVVLLCGGDKRTQHRDIGRAKELAKEDRNGS